MRERDEPPSGVGARAPHTRALSRARRSRAARAFSATRYAFHGHGLLTHNLNQHLPQYCADCWLTAASSMIADRIKIARYAEGSALGPDIGIAMQTVLNCAKRKAGTCISGTLHGVFDYIQDADGVPYDTCQNYEATDSEVCWAPTYCKACKGLGECFGVPAKPSWDPEGHGFWFNGVPKVEVQEWGYIGTLLNNTVRDLQIEIVTRGPIACMVDPRPLNSYKEGIIDAAWDASVGYAHVVEVVGWGEKDGNKFWHIRNSWGDYWGERGFGRVARDSASSTAYGSIGIQGMCSWAVPNKWGQIYDTFGQNFNGKKDRKNRHKGDKGGTVPANVTEVDDDDDDGINTNRSAGINTNHSQPARRQLESTSMFDSISSGQAGQWNREAVENLWRRGSQFARVPTSYVVPGVDAEALEQSEMILRKAPMSDGDGNRGSGGGSPQDGYTQDGSFDEPNGNSPQRMDATPGSPTSSSSGGFGGVGSYLEPGASAIKNLRKAPMSDGDGNRGSGGGSPQDGYTQDGSFDEPNGNSPQLLVSWNEESFASSHLVAVVGVMAGLGVGFLGGFLSGRRAQRRSGFEAI